MITLKVTRNQRLTLSLENTFFEKPQRLNLTLPGILGLSLKMLGD